MQQQLMQLQIQKLQMEIAEIQSRTELNHAKSQSEVVQAQQGVLDNVEQETGTKHAREMEKQVAQSTGNQALEVTKALLKPKKPEESKPDVEAAVGWNAISKQDNHPLATATQF
jgi:hypothetical protein